MPKDKDFGITMKEADARTKALAMAADSTKLRRCYGKILIDKEYEKAEPQDGSEIICYYYTGQEPHSCPGPMGDECHYVIKNGNLVMAHKSCHKRDQDGEKKTPNVIIR